MRKKEKHAKTVLYLVLPDEKKGMKATLERLASLHNRTLTGECIQALEEFITRHEPPPAGTPANGKDRAS